MKRYKRYLQEAITEIELKDGKKIKVSTLDDYGLDNWYLYKISAIEFIVYDNNKDFKYYIEKYKSPYFIDKSITYNVSELYGPNTITKFPSLENALKAISKKEN